MSATREASHAVLAPVTEQEVAGVRHRQGIRVRNHRGRLWEETRPGFYQPIHWLARLPAAAVTRPARLCWGFRATLSDDDAGAANGSLPVHILTDVAGYDLATLSSQRRYHLRKAHRLAELVQITSPALLREQGYEVMRSAVTRGMYSSVPPRARYLAALPIALAPAGPEIAIGGLIGGRLQGYVTGIAVGGTAYIEGLFVVTEFLTTNIGSALVYEFVQACRRSGRIQEVVYGLHSREDPPLCVYKAGMGFRVWQVPARVSLHPIAAAYLRRRRPHVYYRLTGRD